MEIILTEKITEKITIATQGKPELIIPLTADDRTRSRQRLQLEDGHVVFLKLPRGSSLQDGDVLQGHGTDRSTILAQISAKPEPVLTVRAIDPFKLLQAAYHLGNRHVPLEITPEYLRLAFDPVLSHMLEHLGVEVQQEVLPFQPEAGAYGHSHAIDANIDPSINTIIDTSTDPSIKAYSGSQSDEVQPVVGAQGFAPLISSISTTASTTAEQELLSAPDQHHSHQSSHHHHA
jgi:urease accessory protein